jgi:hypothetical protein
VGRTQVHINWPGLVVDQDGAVQLMHHLISTLNNIYMDRDWTTVIDASVYGTSGSKGSGFRLPWCDHCHVFRGGPLTT